MKKPQQLALVGAGKFTDSPLTRMQDLAGQLGPVKAPSLRVASRISNSLRAGYAVSDYEEFQNSELVLISVPDDLLSGVIADMTAAPISWHGKAVVVCSPCAGCDQLRPLARAGAVIGSLATIPGYEHRWVLLEGDRTVERLVRGVIAYNGLRITTIHPFHKKYYLDSLTSVGTQFVPCLKEATEALKCAGVDNNEATAIIEKQVTRTMRSYFRSGKLVGSNT